MNNDQILEKTPEKLSADISTLIRSRSFFTDVEAVNILFCELIMVSALRL